jgi:hypothetical protein
MHEVRSAVTEAPSKKRITGYDGKLRDSFRVEKNTPGGPTTT